MAERVIDYISGIEVPATPEEIEATQVFSKLLVEDYGYPKEHIQTRPQFRVKVYHLIQRKNTLLTLRFSLTLTKQTIIFILLSSVRRKTEKMEKDS